ncbi:ribosomal protein S10 [Kwoniella sp. DSM 27419]
MAALPPVRSALAIASRPAAANAVASSSRYLRTTASVLASPPIQSSASSSSSPATSTEDSGSALPVPLRNIKFLSMPELKPIKPEHGIHVATLHLQSYHPYNLDLTAQFAVHSAQSLNIPTSLPAFLPREKSLYTVLKSPFVKKKAQENFERRTHKRAIKVYDATQEGVDLWLRYLRQNGLPGVGMKAYIHERVELGFGQKEGGASEPIDEKKIAAAAEELVKVLSESEEGQRGDV